MPTPVVLTGFEHGNLSVNGAGIVNTINGSIASVATDQANGGTYSLKVAASANTGYVAWTLSTPTVLVGRIYLRLNALPGVANLIFCNTITTAGATPRFRITSAGVINAGWNTGTAQNGPTLSAGVWYRVDFRADQGSGTKTIDWQVDGVAQTQATLVEAASTFTSTRLGVLTSDTFTVWYDDIFISTTSGDYPIGASKIVGLSPVSDGTHNAGTNVMEDASGNDIGAVAAWSLLDDVPLSAGGVADRVQQTAVGTGNYAEVNFANMPSSSAINGARAYVCYQSSNANANQGATIVSADSFSTFSDVFGNPTTPADMSETSDFWKSVIVVPPGGSWSEAEINALQMRIGYSGDVDGIPYWLGLMVEMDYVAGAGGTRIKDMITSDGVMPKKR